ncbi:urease accessory protein UreF [Pseudomonas guariconensis]|uniref:urease accessory protein UreF n=1 Tax=Pseudomonas TaxID=286 RepID=UPI001CE476EF|nr:MULTISPECIES: urease accessory protein UreF [Pseudomonas]MCO7638605.1 urease accessory protein UreF [Pseudomonas sp. S 311-6]MCO7513864.1 urease accessory protein UreF [Pseudomonas putida]MCO7565907.1 urease accessory protein UreF [Pseudomonas mosselii]MCO7595564.1 urease accessory protein UreF [Pseudomonas guariconensis]MCO7605333.1 urease accessory protein UreF [Pseudomonas guariconensis]
MDSDLALLRLLQLASPGLPVGGFTYSQGLEWAVEVGWVGDVASFGAWQREQLHDTLGYLDWPVLARLYRACQAGDAEAFGQWSRFLLANRETAELRLEERQRGSALARLLDGWQLAQAPAWRASLELSQLGGMAWLGAHWSIPLRQLALGHGYAWLEGAVMAGVKLVPFGQQAAQTLLRDLGEALPTALDQALALEDDQLGGGLPLLAIASSRHETQYTRLFRS